MNYYQVLGISPSATKDEIKAAYRKLAKKYHPDLNKEKGAQKKFIEVQQAYEGLMRGEKEAPQDTNNWYEQAKKRREEYKKQHSRHQQSSWEDFTESYRAYEEKYQDPFANFYRTQWKEEDTAISSNQVRKLLIYDIDKRPPVFSQFGYVCDGCHKSKKGGNMLYYFANGEKKLCLKCKTDILDWFKNDGNFR